MRKTISILALFLIFLAAFVACDKTMTDKEIQIPDEYLDFSNEDTRTYIEDEEAIESFEKFFYVNNVVDSECYLIDKELNVSVYLADDIYQKDVKNIELFFTKILILKQYETYPVPYGDLYNNKIDYDTCILRIFFEDTLLIYDKYDFNECNFEYYENVFLDIPSRNYSDDYSDKVIENLKENIKSINEINVIKPFRAYSIMFLIDTKSKLENEDLKYVKNIIESNLEIKEDINSYVGIIVQLTSDSDVYEEFTYLNNGNGWNNEKWENIDFTSEALIY
ncbi:MAG: hypothetical protein PHT02_06360 [Tissierellia bacterium]|nr:hypothetical protein [Tissierellia bacterium]